MVKKNKKWEWTEKQERVFGELKRRFTEEPVVMGCFGHKQFLFSFSFIF